MCLPKNCEDTKAKLLTHLNSNKWNKSFETSKKGTSSKALGVLCRKEDYTFNVTSRRLSRNIGTFFSYKQEGVSQWCLFFFHVARVDKWTTDIINRTKSCNFHYRHLIDKENCLLWNHMSFLYYSILYIKNNPTNWNYIISFLIQGKVKKKEEIL